MKICSIKKVITGQSRKYGFEVKGEEHTHGCLCAGFSRMPERRTIF